MGVEKAGAVGATRDSSDTLMGTFGTPDTGSTVVISFDGSVAGTLIADKWYRFISNQDCHLHFHASEAATTSHMLLKSGVPEIFYTGNLTRVVAIKNASTGILYCTPIMTDSRDV